LGDEEGLAGIFIPGMLPISVLFAGFCFVGVFLLDDALRLDITGIFIPGIFIPGMLLMSCFFTVCFFCAVFLFLGDVAFGLDFAFGLLIPGILDISCCARTGKLATNRQAAKTNAHTLICKLKLIVLTFFIIPSRKLFHAKEVFSTERQLQP
jgi:hypothetical protein